MIRKARSTDRKKIEVHYAPKSVSEVNDRTTIESNRRMSGELDRYQRPQRAHTYLHTYNSAGLAAWQKPCFHHCTSVRLVTRVRGRSAYYEETHVTHERRVTIARRRSSGSRGQSCGPNVLYVQWIQRKRLSAAVTFAARRKH